MKNIKLTFVIATILILPTLSQAQSGSTAELNSLKTGPVTSFGPSSFGALDNPSIISVTPSIAGSTTWGYKIVARVGSNHTSASIEGTTTIGPASLAGASNTITWNQVLGADVYDVYRTTVGTSPSTTGLIGTVDSNTLFFVDTGLAGDSTVPPTSNNTGIVAGLIFNATTYQVAGSPIAFSNLAGSVTTGQEPSTTVNSVTGETNIGGSISAQNLTFAWLGTLADARLTSSYSGVGNCPTHQVANSLTRNTAPGCIQLQYSDIGGTPPSAANTPAIAHEWLNSFNATLGTFGQTRPAAADLSDGTTGSGSVMESTSPTSTNQTINQAANGNDAITTSRATDTSPTGNFLRFKNAGGTDVYKVDVLGNETSNSVSTGSVNGALYASKQSGATADVQLSNAIAALPSGAGTVVADYTSNQTWAACPTFGSGKVTVILYPVSYAVSATCTVPNTVTLSFRNGALLAPGSGINVTINGYVDAGAKQKLVNLANGNVLFFGNRTVYANWYGAMGDNSNDDFAAIEQEIDNNCSTSSPSSSRTKIVLACGLYLISKPLRPKCGGIQIEGEGKNCTMIRPSFQGPAMIDMGTQPSLPLTTQLATGTGSSLALDGAQDFNLNLNDATHLSRFGTTPTLLNGLTQFSAEMYVNLTSIDPNNNQMITSSQGDPFSNDASGQQIPTYQIYVRNGNLNCTLNVSGTNVSIGAAISTGTTHFISCDWDGSTVRLFIDGTSVASTSASGALVQPIFQTVTVGNPVRFMEAGSFNTMANGKVDSIRLSDSVRHTANYTAPTAKLAADGSTIALLNFDDQTKCDICTPIHTKHGDVVTWFRFPPPPNSNGFQQWKNIWFNGSVVAGGAAQSSWTDVVFQGFPYSLYLAGNNFITSLNDINFLTSSQSCMFQMGISGGGSGDLLLKNVSFGACGTAISGSGDTSLTMNGGLVQGGIPMRYAFLFQASGPTNQLNFNGVGVSQEQGVDSNFVASYGFGQAGLQANFFGGTIETFVSAPVFIVDGITSLNAQGMQFKSFSGSTATSIFNVISPPAHPMNLQADIQTDGPIVPWCSSGATDFCKINDPGFLTVAFSSTPTFDCSLANDWKLTLTGNVTSSTLTHCTKGQSLSFTLCQDGTGSRTFAWPSNVLAGGTITPTLNVCSTQRFLYDGTNARATSLMVADNTPASGEVLTVSNDTNVTGSISGNNLALGWAGTLAKARTLATTVYTDQANSYTAGSKQTVSASSTTAGLGFGGVTADPSSLSSGDMWYRTDAAHLKFRDNSSTTHSLFNSDDTLPGAQQTVFSASGTGHSQGAVPDPGATSGTKRYLREDATWTDPISTQTAPSHQYATGTNDIGTWSFAQPAFADLTGLATPSQLPVMIASGPSHAAGIAPDPGSTAGSSKFLREDATWADPSTTLSESINTQTSTTYTIASSDRGKLITASNSSASSYTLPQAGGSFPSGWFTYIQNTGAGVVTITPTTSTINGTATYTLNKDQGIKIVSDGTNYSIHAGMKPVKFSAVSHQFLTSVDDFGLFSAAQPSFSDISGAATAGQEPSTTVNSFVNDTNVTASISSQAATIGWTGTLAKTRTLATTVYTDQANTFGAFLQSFQAGNNFNLVDPTITTKAAKFDLSNISASTTVTVNIPNAGNSTTVQSLTSVSHQFVISMNGQGVFSTAQPAFSDLSGSATCAQLPALTADVTTTAGNCSTTVTAIGGSPISSPSAAVFQLGGANSASPTAQTLQAQGSRSGTDTNVSGANLTVASGQGTGNSAASSIAFQTPTVGSTGTTAETMATRFTISTTALTATIPHLVANGTNSAPSYAFSSDATTGVYRPGTSLLSFVVSSAEIQRLNGSTGDTQIGHFNLCWGSTTVSCDAFIRRNAAAVIQLGNADAASPVAQTLTAQNPRGGTDTNVAGPNFTIQTPLGTGNSTPSMLNVTSPALGGSSGTTAQTAISRLAVNDTKSLTSGSAVTLLSIPLATLQMTGGSIDWTAEATDGTNQCSTSGETVYAGENSAGVFVTNTSIIGTAATACTTGSTLTCTFSMTGANPSLVQATCTLTGITSPTSFSMIYSVLHRGRTAPTL